MKMVLDTVLQRGGEKIQKVLQEIPKKKRNYSHNNPELSVDNVNIMMGLGEIKDTKGYEEMLSSY